MFLDKVLTWLLRSSSSVVLMGYHLQSKACYSCCVLLDVIFYNALWKLPSFFSKKFHRFIKILVKPNTLIQIKMNRFDEMGF